MFSQDLSKFVSLYGHCFAMLTKGMFGDVSGCKKCQAQEGEKGDVKRLCLG